MFHHLNGGFYLTREEQDVFREYLRSIEDELLASVSADYIWLASQTEDEQPESRFQWRRAACQEECSRRGKPRIWRCAQNELSGAMDQVA